MDSFLLAARLVLALVLFFAGAMKLASLTASTKALTDLGVPDLLARPIAIVLPPLEIAIALALLSTTLAWWGATATLLLMLIFTAVLGINLARGRTADCHCFGQLSNNATALPALWRNQMLAALALLLMWQGWTNTGPDVFSSLASFTATDRVRLTIGIVLLGVFAARKQLVAALRRRNSSIQGKVPLTAGTANRSLAAGTPAMFRTAGLPVGTVVPNVILRRGNHSHTVKLHSLFHSGKPRMLIFIDPDCVTCKALLPQINDWSSRYAHDLTITVITRENGSTVELDSETVLFQQTLEVADSFTVTGFPSAVIVGPDMLVASRLAFGAEAISNLITGTVPIASTSTVRQGCAAC
jgi:uncharacterized membrane protein YphA (DoxX/SURF4 family)